MNYLRSCIRLIFSIALISSVGVTASHAATSAPSIFLPMVIAAKASQTTPTPPTATTTPPTTPTITPTAGVATLNADEQEILRLTNELRSSVGCGPLAIDSMLEQAAVLHSTDMADHNTMSHTGSDGSMPWDRAATFGYTGSIGENVAMGYRTAADVFQAWKNSSGHYKNLVNCTYRDTGISLKKTASGTPYWTQIFGRKQ